MTLFIDNVNDNAPMFEKPVYHLKVLENEPIGYVLLTLKAHDSDFGDQKLKYLLNDQKAIEYVDLNSETGVLSLIQSFDYEKIQNLSFEVIVKDNGQPALETKSMVQIEILDLNDNSPVFEKNLYEASVQENQPLGTKIVKVSNFI